MAIDNRMIQDAMSAWLSDFQKHILHGITMEIRTERVHNGIEHTVRKHTFLPRSFSRIPKAIAAIEDTANIRSQMETDGELVAVTKAVPIVAVTIPEACAVAIIIPTAGI